MTHFKINLNLSLTVIDVSVFFPFAEYGMSCCVLNDKLYMVGGQTSRTDVFNLITGEWLRTKDCNTKRMEAQVKRYGGANEFKSHFKNLIFFKFGREALYLRRVRLYKWSLS